MEEYEQHPMRMRVKTLQYMLAVNGLDKEQAIVSQNAACQLQIECKRDGGWHCGLPDRNDEAGGIGQPRSCS